MAQKVLVLSNMYPGKKSNTFGIFVKNQVQALKERGLAVDVIAVNDPSMGKAAVLTKYLLWVCRTLFNLLFKGKQYDVVHVHYVFPTGMLGLFYKKLYRTRLIVTAHGGDIDKMSKKGARISQWTKQILQEADHVIAVGDRLSQDIQEQFDVPAEKISVINMGVNREVFRPLPKQEARKRCGVSQEEKLILFAGNLIRQKGLIELIQAFQIIHERHPQACLTLIGSVKDPAFLQEAKNELARLKVEESTSILPAMPQTEVAAWMAAADVFVLPSHIEGFGLVALEAMSCHTPVVGSDVGGLSYLLKDGHGVLVPPKDPVLLAEGIEKVLSDPEFAARLTERGEQRAEANDQILMVKRVIELYSPTRGKML